MKFHLLTFGKLRTPGLREAMDYYLRNLGAWATPIEIEFKASDRKEIEADTLLTWMCKNPRVSVVLLSEEGRSLATLGWSEWIRTQMTAGTSEIAWLIGGTNGFTPEIRREVKLTLSLGAQTLGHEIARLVLCEQLYRAMSVIHGHPYHREGN